MYQPRIIIIGCGVGGLTTALQLHAHGFKDVHLFEAASSLTTLGVGINVQPSAVLHLRDLGLLPALQATGVETAAINYFDRHGNAIISEARGIRAGYTIPQFSIHRGELQMLLLDAVRERLGDDRVHLNHALATFSEASLPHIGTGYAAESSGETITAYFVRRRDPDTPPEVPTMSADLMIAADGINSTVRRLLYPTEGPPRFSGRMLWRGCVERAPYLTGASMVWSGHANQKFIAYPISSACARRGTSFVNWIAELRVRDEKDPDTTPPEKTDWTMTVPKERFAGKFKDWTFGFLNVPELIDSTEKVFEFPMCDRDPAPQWTFGRLTLLGDAAHPMYPIGSNGASQAILDASALVKCLLAHPSIAEIPQALLDYQNERLPVTAKIVMANRANGPDHVLQVAHERAPNGFKDIHDIISKEELDGIGLAYKAIVGLEMEKVNEAAKATEGTAEAKGLKPPAAWLVGGEGGLGSKVKQANGTH